MAIKIDHITRQTDMPKCCTECNYISANSNGLVMYCYITGEVLYRATDKEDCKNRGKNCPLKEVNR